MSKKKIQGRIALIEKMVGNDTIVLIFELPNDMTGNKLAIVGCFGVEMIKEIEPGKTRYAQFCEPSEHTFNEEIAIAREYKGARIHIGNYQGVGLLNDDCTCSFTFTTDVFKSRWRLAQVEKLFSLAFWKRTARQRCLVLERTA